jgi:putative ABC transport system substrate-binding protein
MFSMRRREFISLLGGTGLLLAAKVRRARAEQPTNPVIGFLNGQSPDTFAHAAAAFREGLKEIGFVDGQNVTIEYRWAEGQNDRLPAMANELVRRQVAVIAATGASAAAPAVKAATSTIPILFIVGADPVKLGLVASLNRPGGNLTGVNQFTNTLSAKRLELLREMLPGATSIAFLLNPDGPQAEFESLDLETAAQPSGSESKF